MKIQFLIKKTFDWLTSTPERSLDRAYKMALKVKEIEDKYFGGQTISQDHTSYGSSVVSYFKIEIDSYLKKINSELNIFKTSRLFLKFINISQDIYEEKILNEEEQQNFIKNTVVLEKLKFIDKIILKYNLSRNENNSNNSTSSTQTALKIKEETNNIENISPKDRHRLESINQNIGVLPRSFVDTLNRLRQEIDPKSEDSEEKVLNRHRKSRLRTALSIKFILLLIIIPLLTHQLTKTFLLTPIIRQYFQDHGQVVFINKDLEEEAFEELSHYEEILRFQGLIGLREPLNEEKVEEKVKEKAQEITQQYRIQGINSVGNVFADLFSVTAFVIVVVFSRKEIEILKAFLDEILYGLSDPAKAFLIILFTDMFVGFHSPHGWEVILEGISHHFGLPENQEFNFLFIATFPVILDTVLKYWIFRYLNRISPSAVATYKNMNE
ncbi:MAG: CemA family [Candidatus Atelocyanobacterium thalassa isolate SIO64986]|uniref:Proton extrusion protein PxcA n=1 Tax=Candidatus Atelocyanobacterium thalassa isolate SIO64986 TaxID=1527444 RepID=A0A086CGZ5_9CHRO|nr:MAG: CemA family [Candidatus Atelocyanobacterium thalassa isolate SIO64986]